MVPSTPRVRHIPCTTVVACTELPTILATRTLSVLKFASFSGMASTHAWWPRAGRRVSVCVCARAYMRVSVCVVRRRKGEEGSGAAVGGRWGMVGGSGAGDTSAILAENRSSLPYCLAAMTCFRAFASSIGSWSVDFGAV